MAHRSRWEAAFLPRHVVPVAEGFSLFGRVPNF